MKENFPNETKNPKFQENHPTFSRSDKYEREKWWKPNIKETTFLMLGKIMESYMNVYTCTTVALNVYTCTTKSVITINKTITELLFRN